MRSLLTRQGQYWLGYDPMADLLINLNGPYVSIDSWSIVHVIWFAGLGWLFPNRLVLCILFAGGEGLCITLEYNVADIHAVRRHVGGPRDALGDDRAARLLARARNQHCLVNGRDAEYRLTEYFFFFSFHRDIWFNFMGKRGGFLATVYSQSRTGYQIGDILNAVYANQPDPVQTAPRKTKTVKK